MRKLSNLVLCLMLMVVFCTSAFAAPQIYETEGIFVLGDNNTKIQARELALQDAKRAALEQAGTYLRSITQVVNGQVTKDEIISIASGIIKAEIISEDFDMIDKSKGITSVTVKARCIIDSDDLQKKIGILRQSEKRQEELAQMADLQNRYDKLLAENNSLKTQLAQANDPNVQKQLLIKTQEIDNQLTATQLYNKGLEYFYANNYDSAIEAYSKSIAIDPQYGDAYNNRGLSYSKKGQHDLAIVDYNKAIQLNPQDVNVYNNRGISYFKKSQYDLAIVDYSKAIQLNPQDANAYVGLGGCYSLKGQYDLAIVNYNKAIQSNPQYAVAYYARGVFYDIKGQDDLAIADYNKAIQLNPQDVDFYLYRGSFYHKKSQYDLAIADFTQIIHLNPQAAYAYYNRGLSYLRKGEVAEALENISAASALDPKNKDFIDAYNKLSKALNVKSYDSFGF